MGLRLEDAEKYGLESEPVKEPPASTSLLLQEHGATDEEIKLLCSGRRIELNAFTSGNFIEFIETKLRQHGVKKVIPEHDVLEKAFRRVLRVNHVEEHIDPLIDEAAKVARATNIPGDLVDRVRAKIKMSGDKLSWDAAIAAVVRDSQLT